MICPTHNPSRTITVTGIGKVVAKPDFAQIQMGVITESIDVGEAQRENAAKMNRIIQALLRFNIPRADIQTEQFNVLPRYDFVDGKQVFRGYEITNSVTVKIRNMQMIGEIIDTAIQNGANRISQIEFKIENEEAYYRNALQLALQNAGEKAVAITEKMQLPYMPVPIKITEIGSSGQVPFRAVVAAESFSTPIEQGTIEVQAQLQVKYQY